MSEGCQNSLVSIVYALMGVVRLLRFGGTRGWSCTLARFLQEGEMSVSPVVS